jgi:hypothetical protein
LRGDHPRLEAIFDEVYREGAAALAAPAADVPAR